MISKSVILTLIAVVTVAVTAGCRAPSSSAVSWRDQLQQELPLLGHRNWIVIADSAYPAQNSPGIQTIYTGAHHIFARLFTSTLNLST